MFVSAKAARIACPRKASRSPASISACSDPCSHSPFISLSSVSRAMARKIVRMMDACSLATFETHSISKMETGANPSSESGVKSKLSTVIFLLNGFIFKSLRYVRAWAVLFALKRQAAVITLILGLAGTNFIPACSKIHASIFSCQTRSKSKGRRR